MEGSKIQSELDKSQTELNESLSDKARAEMIVQINRDFRHKVMFWTFYMTLPFTLMGQIKSNIISEVFKWLK